MLITLEVKPAYRLL